MHSYFSNIKPFCETLSKRTSLIVSTNRLSQVQLNSLTIAKAVNKDLIVSKK